MACRVEIFRHPSRLLADNPLGDPAERAIGVVLPPSYDTEGARRFPTVTILSGFTGTGLHQLNRSSWGASIDERLDSLVASGRAAEAILVLPDCFTRYGGSQYVDSPAIGRYQSYLCDEVLPAVDARFRTIARREGRALLGKSSGGYGALAIGIQRPELFGAIGSHAGDSAFELCYLPEFPRVLLALERHGGLKGVLGWFDSLPAKTSAAIEILSNLCAAAAWSPSARGPYGYGEGFELPFDLRTGALRQEVWARWLAADPVRMLDDERALAALGSMRALYLDGGRSDEFNLQLGARQVAAKLAAAGIPHVHEEFDGGHMNVSYRYDRSLEVLTRALAS